MNWTPMGVPLYSQPYGQQGQPLMVPLYSTPGYPRVGAAGGEGDIKWWAPAPADLAIGGAVGFVLGLIIGRLL